MYSTYVCMYVCIFEHHLSLQDMFYSVESVLKRFLDVDHLFSLCVQVTKQDNIKAAESKITKVCFRGYIFCA